MNYRFISMMGVATVLMVVIIIVTINIMGPTKDARYEAMASELNSLKQELENQAPLPNQEESKPAKKKKYQEEQPKEKEESNIQPKPTYQPLPESNNPAEEEKKRMKEAIEKDYLKMLHVKATCTQRILGGVYNASVSLANISRFTFDEVTVTYYYKKANGETFDYKTLTFYNVGPTNAAYNKPIPSTETKGIGVGATISDLKCYAAGITSLPCYDCD